MKLTDGLFPIPIKIYDRFIMEKNAREMEENIDKLERPPVEEWVKGYIHVPIDSIIGYRDDFDDLRSVKEVAEEGFDGTLVYTTGFGRLECVWKKEKFEKEFNAFAQKYEKGITDLVNEAFAVKEQEQPKKKSWWKR